MNDLDDKLREILLTGALGDEPPWSDVMDAVIAQLKQAFADEYGDFFTNYGTATKMTLLPPVKVMTGQEWFDRFEKELAEGHAFDQRSYSAIQKAARRASGIEATDE